MPLRDLLKKRDALSAQASTAPPPPPASLVIPEFKIVRTTTHTEEVIEPPSFPEDDEPERFARGRKEKEKDHKRHLGFRKSSNSAITKDPTAQAQHTQQQGQSSEKLPLAPGKKEHRLSGKFRIPSRSRTPSASSSTILPSDLPDAPDAVSVADGTAQDKDAKEAQEAKWEKRATMLAMGNPLLEAEKQQQQQQQLERSEKGTATTRSRSPSISAAGDDVSLQEAVRLHESGELERSTQMFGQLADPKGANNALAQVLYGLALRHGWGIVPSQERAVHYLSLAASNSATIEQQALASGMTKGGAAKGELVLAIFELANCFRHGWGVKKDPVAARQYYETAANLGDTDAMEEAAWCYVEGFGGGKDKFKAAQYLRLAEKKGSSQVGNSWIWKDKYNPK